MKDIGAAMAVLGLYVFMLLVPLHQAAGLQRDLADLGFATAAEWSVCTPLAMSEDGEPIDGQPQCGLGALAKAGLAMPPAGPVLALPDMPGNGVFAREAETLPAQGIERLNPPRAPPVAV